MLNCLSLLHGSVSQMVFGSSPNVVHMSSLTSSTPFHLLTATPHTDKNSPSFPPFFANDWPLFQIQIKTITILSHSTQILLVINDEEDINQGSNDKRSIVLKKDRSCDMLLSYWTIYKLILTLMINRYSDTSELHPVCLNFYYNVFQGWINFGKMIWIAKMIEINQDINFFA